MAQQQQQQQQPHSLGELLDRIETVVNREARVSVQALMDEVGYRSYGPMLLIPGLVMFAPGLGDIPGVPVIMGLLVALTAAQLLFRRRCIWVPRWLQRRSVSRKTVEKIVKWSRRPAAFMDRWTKRRLQHLVRNPANLFVALSCIAIGLATPVMEVVPFSANVAGAAIIGFGLALIAHDGLLALIAFAFTLTTLGLLGYNFLAG